MDAPARAPQPTILRGHGVVLEPLVMDHSSGLFAALGTGDEVFRWLRTEAPRCEADMAALVDALLTQQAEHGSVAFAVRDAASGRIAGWTRYQRVELEHARLSIGWTWYGRPWWGSVVHPAARLLLLAHAFEELCIGRVEWKVDTGNLRNQQTLDTMGAVREGVLRHYWVRPGGSRRDCVAYSVLAHEWPAVRARLLTVVKGRAEHRGAPANREVSN